MSFFVLQELTVIFICKLICQLNSRETTVAEKFDKSRYKPFYVLSSTVMAIYGQIMYEFRLIFEEKIIESMKNY